MRCEHCNRTNRPDASFCDTCGREFGKQGRPPADQVDTATDTTGAVNREHPHAGRTDGVFVGRQSEMDLLQTALEDALDGRGRLVMLVGEPGIGKTRMAQELAIYAAQRGVQVLWGRCYEEPGTPPYWPWAQAIRSYIREHDPQTLRAEMQAGAADIAEMILEVRASLPDLEAPQRLADPTQARFRLFDAIAIFLKNASQKHPLMLIFDNVHWADTPSLRLLVFLVSELRDSQLLIVGTYRDRDLPRQHPLSDTLGELTGEPSFQRVRLRGLRREDIGHLMEHAVRNSLPKELVDAVYRQTEGNPLFLKEIVRFLL